MVYQPWVDLADFFVQLNSSDGSGTEVLTAAHFFSWFLYP